MKEKRNVQGKNRRVNRIKAFDMLSKVNFHFQRIEMFYHSTMFYSVNCDKHTKVNQHFSFEKKKKKKK